jgi:hypothetical protein
MFTILKRWAVLSRKETEEYQGMKALIGFQEAALRVSHLGALALEARLRENHNAVVGYLMAAVMNAGGEVCLPAAALEAAPTLAVKYRKQDNGDVVLTLVTAEEASAKAGGEADDCGGDDCPCQ